MPKRILLVEDEALIAMNEAHMLKKYGYEVITAYSGEKAIEEVDSARGISLILMDIDLGKGMDGTEAAKRILEQHDLPVVFLTSHAEKEYVDRVKKIANYGYVLKNSGEFVLNESIEMAYQLFDSYKRLQEKEEQLNLAMDAADHGYWDYNLDTGEAYFSPKYCEMLGYGPDELQQQYETWEQLLHPEDKEYAIETVQKKIKLVEPFELEFRLRTKAGGWKWIKGKGNSYQVDENGTPHRVVGTHEDINERKQTNNALSEKTEMLDNTLGNISDLVVVADVNGYITYHSDVYGTIGYEQDALIGRHVLEFVHPQDLPEIESSLKDFIHNREDRRRVEYRFRCADGSYIWMETDGKTIKDENGNIKELLFTSRAITERKKTEKELEYERTFLNTVLDNIKEALIICNGEGKITRFNDSARSLHGVPEQPITPDKWAQYYDLYYPDGSTPLATEDIPLYRALNGYDVHNHEIIVKPKHKSPRFLSCNGRQLHDASGNVIGAVIAMHDITGYKEAEQSLQNTVEEKNTLMRELNHRVKNNLHMISSLISLKDTALGDAGDLTDIKHRIDAIQTVYQQLSQTEDFSHIRVKDYMQAVLSSVFNNSSFDIEIENNIEEIELPSKRAVALALITNEIATNAVKYGFVKGEKASFSVSLYEDTEEHQYEYILSNSGNPFPDDIDFEKADSLGLSLIHGLVSQLDGTVELRKNPSPVFTIRFPIGNE
jgi:PAS domain S-box-containing protein